MTPKIISQWSRKPESRIIKIRYRGGPRGRVAIAYAKVPYAGSYALTELLTRLMLKGEIRWFRIEPASPLEIETQRDTLQRWPEALRQTIKITGVNLGA